MDRDKITSFGIPENKFYDLMIDVINFYPIASNGKGLYEYETKFNGTKYFMPNLTNEPHILAEYIIFPDEDSVDQFLSDYEYFQETGKPKRDLMDENILFFKIKENGNQILGILESGGELEKKSKEYRSEMMREFLEAARKELKLATDN